MRRIEYWNLGLSDGASTVHRLMTEPAWDIPAGNQLLPKGEESRGSIDRILGGEIADFSLTRQLATTLYEPTAINTSLTTSPDAYLFTSRSAIPVAYALRQALKDLRNTSNPLLTYVRADRASAHLHFSGAVKLRPRRPLNLRPATEQPKRSEEAMRLRLEKHEEVARLTELVRGMGHVCVVEQYSDTGWTASYAAELAYRAGARQVSLIGGVWYGSVEHAVEESGLSSPRYRKFMTATGKTCAQRITEHFANIR